MYEYCGQAQGDLMSRVNDKITILTEPTYQSPMTDIGALKRYIKKVLRYAQRGPSAVLRSLTNGFKGEGVNFNYNPRSIKEVGDVVMVLSNIEALKEAIELKRSGKIKKILAGPNLMDFSDEFDGTLACVEVDICIVASEWMRAAFEKDNPALVGKVRVWHAGVDESYWQPDRRQTSQDVLIYWKTEPEEFICCIEDKLRDFGFRPFRIAYGQYSPDEFKRKLSRAGFAVFVSKSETQGVALAESWAMDVPTLVWDPKTFELRGRVFLSSSSAPYLNSSVGWDWQTLSDLEAMLKRIHSDACTFQPRAWVLKNMTDQASVRLLLKIIYP
jgi:hypothetical protein